VGFSHLLIAIGGGGCVYISCYALGFGEFSLAPALFISVCTGLGYSIQRFIKASLFPDTVPKDRLAYLSKYGWGLISFWVICFLASLFFLDLHFSAQSWSLLCVLGGLGLGYAILPKRISHIARSMREIAGVKLPLLSIVWGGATVVLPLFFIDALGSTSLTLIIWLFISRVLYVGGLTIPFDVRDLNVDNAFMKTLPQAIGSEKSLMVAMFLIGISGLIWLILIATGDLGVNTGVALALHTFATIPLVSPRMAKAKRHEYYYSIILDGMLAIQIAPLFMVLS
jgi:hypothetical protein